MFEITHDLIKQYASLRNEDAHVMPMYVSLYNERYSLTDLDSITNYSPNSIKVGFVSVISPIEKRPCTLASMYEVNVIESFVEHDDSTGIDTTYLLFETGMIDGNGDIYNQINYYVNALDNKVKDIVNEYRNRVRESMNDYYS
jgi:hypothetical protein